MSLAGKTVLVTGGTGFVGGRLVEKLVLEQQAQVRVLVRNFGNACRLARFPLEIIGGDITDEAVVNQAIQGCDYVFHCAHESKLNRNRQKQMAVEGTKNISQAALRAGVQQMVQVSSVVVYGPTSAGDLTEETPWQPSDHSYVQAKRAAERLVLDMHRQKGLPVVVLQPTAVYGPYCRPWTLQPINDLKTGLVPLINSGTGYCNAVYVDDVVDAMILAATRPEVRGEVFLISGEEPVSWKTFYSAFETALGIQATVEISAGQVEEMQRKQMQQASATTQLFNMARQPHLASYVIKIPPVRGSIRLLKSFLSEEQRQSLKSYVKPNGSKRYKQENSSGHKAIHIPNETLLSFYQSRTWVRIDKAKKQLGYIPRFDFERGMALTTQFIRWANLA